MPNELSQKRLFGSSSEMRFLEDKRDHFRMEIRRTKLEGQKLAKQLREKEEMVPIIENEVGMHPDDEEYRAKISRELWECKCNVTTLRELIEYKIEKVVMLEEIISSINHEMLELIVR